MKALFLAGGKGVRLQPLTDNMPKPMVPIMNRPLLERTMINLKANGITEIVISTCYRTQYIEDYFGNGERLGLNIQYIVEETAQGTGGAIKNTELQFTEPFIVFNSDILSDLNIKKLIDFHKSKGALATITATEVSDPSMYGVIECDPNGYATSFIEKPKPEQIFSKYINAGIYIFEPEILKEIPINIAISMEREIFPKILEKGFKLAVYKDSSYWMDIGTLGKYLQTHMDIMDGKCNLVDCFPTEVNIRLGKNVKIHPEATIIGPVYIGDNVEIGANAYISRSVIGSNTFIGRSGKIVGSVIWDNNRICSHSRIMNTIITSNCIIKQRSNLINTVYSIEVNKVIAI